VLAKKQNPVQQVGGKDKPLSNAGQFDGMMHCGLTFDVSVFYRIEGSNPKVLKLYGLFSHDESGTGSPASIKRQKSLASKFNQQTF
jgi:mRNA-degrading endonuclease YafQ of YafQ-DinJ toxin-antitoxin module